MTDALDVFWRSVLTPRTAVRRLMESSISEAVRARIFWATVLITIVSSTVLAWREYEAGLPLLPYAVPGSSRQLGYFLTEGLLYGAAVACVYPLTIFVWEALFSDRDCSEPIRNAAAASFAFEGALTPMSDAAIFFAGESANANIGLLTFSVVVLLGVSTIFFSEALSISYIAGLWKNALAILLVTIFIGVPIAVLWFAFFWSDPAFAGLSGSLIDSAV